MPYSNNKKFMALLLSILMTLGLGTSSKKDLLDKDLVPQSIEFDYFKNIDAKIIDLDYGSLDRNLDLEDIVYLGLCADLLHEYLGKMTMKEIDLRLCSDVDGLTKDQLQFLDEYDDYNDYYLHIISKLGKLFDKYYAELASYIDNNKSFLFENEDTLISKANFNLSSYGLGNVVLRKDVILPPIDFTDISIDYRNFKPYRKYNFIDENVPIKLKGKDENSNNLPDEYAMLPENIIIDDNFDYRKYGINQYPLKNVSKTSKTKRKKGLKPNFIDNDFSNQYKNPMITNYPLGAAKKRGDLRY